MTITEKMRTQIRGLNRASGNAEDGISLIQTAEGALNEVHALLQRARLSATEASAFAPSSLSGSSSNYVVNSDNTKYANAFGVGYIFPQKGKGVATGTGESAEALNLQVGALSGQKIVLEKYDVSSGALFGAGGLDVSDFSAAGETIKTIDEAIDRVSGVRSYYGAMQNRLEHTIANLDNTSENTSAAESRIRDTDMAKEIVENSKTNILIQAAQSVLAQSNHNKDGVLSLIAG